MVWFVISSLKTISLRKYLFQTKLTYGMICYVTNSNAGSYVSTFQTKLTYGMICYGM